MSARSGHTESPDVFNENLCLFFFKTEEARCGKFHEKQAIEAKNIIFMSIRNIFSRRILQIVQRETDHGSFNDARARASRKVRVRLQAVRALSLAGDVWEANRSVCARACVPNGHGERKSQRQSAPPFTGLTDTVIGYRGAGTPVQPSCRKRGRMAEHFSSRPRYRRKRVMRDAARSMSRLASTSG